MRWMLLAGILGLAGCMSTVALDYQEKVDFSRYDSFAIVDADPVHSLDSKRVRAALMEELPALGLRQVPPGEADLIVRHRFLEAEDVDSTDVFWGVGAGVGAGNVGLGINTPIGVRSHTEYTLVVEMVDTARDEVVWQARSRRSLSSDSAAPKRTEWITTVVDDMLERFPPERDLS